MSAQGLPHREAIIPPWWSSALSSITEACSAQPVVVICGPKNSGKSTFSRYLLNNLFPRYGKIAYLDTDVGQPEFNLPGCISLHIVDEMIADLMSPKLRPAERCFFYGDVSSKSDPEAYKNCIFKLYDYFMENFQSKVIKREEKQVLPLIINTPGWVKGIGFELLVEMLRYIMPTTVVQLRISAKHKNLPVGAFWLDGEPDRKVDLINILSAQQDSYNRSILISKDTRGMRDTRIMEYFKQCLPHEVSIKTNKELAYALCSLPPYEVRYSKIKVTHLHCKVPSSEIFHSLNATIVGLAVSSETHGKSNPIPSCVGLGIVRGIDVSRDLLYVITPVSLQRLQKVDLLLQGFIEIPTTLLKVKHCVSPYMSIHVHHKIVERALMEA